MKDLLRETIFGHAVRLLSGGRYLAHDDSYNTSKMQLVPPVDSETSSRLGIGGSDLDAEKGKDTKLVEWTENDPQNPRNWSTPKKFFVTFEVCFLTTSVYIGKFFASGLSLIWCRPCLLEFSDRFCNLYGRYSGHHAGLWRQRGCCTAWLDVVCSGLCTRAHDLGM